ncbi:hypothetical protein DFH06DRAFT_1136471 [Mycena polygramma]|nr:hypothetical protein DFH06DRAFT_1136471 [Mycena polygramma]
MSNLTDVLCRECTVGYITYPDVCVGFHTPGPDPDTPGRNSGDSFQKCQFNNFSRVEGQNICPRGYWWRPDIPKADIYHPKRTYSRMDYPTTPPAWSAPTSFSSPSTSTSSPSKKKRAPKVACISTTCTQKGTHGGHRNGKCLWMFCKTCCQRTNTTERCPAPGHMDPPTPALNSFTATSSSSRLDTTPAAPAGAPLIFAKPMGRMVDAVFAHKFLEGDHEIATTDHFQRELYRKSQVNSMKVRLWVQNGADAVTLVIALPHFPYFHPKDCQPIVSIAKNDTCVTYGYWDTDEWILTETPMVIKGGTKVLFLRLQDVTDCVGGPLPKRRLSDASFHTPTPTRARIEGQRPDISPLSYDISPAKDSIISLSSDSEGEEIVPNKSSSSRSRPAGSASPSKTPTQPKFPLEYACDMHVGFLAMKAASSGSIPQRFTAAFKVAWVSSTYYTHFNAWNDMDKEAREYAVQCRHNVGGDWGALFKTHTSKGKGRAVKSQHQVAGGKGLKIEHLRHLLRIHLKKGALRPTPVQYEDAAQLIADNESFGVNWTYVLHQTGPRTAVDVKMAEYYAKKVLVPPPDVDLEPPSSPLTDPGPDVHMEPEPPVQNIRMPTPMPTSRCTVWRGTSEELAKDTNILWRMLSFDAGSDVKTMDPRVVVVNQLDDEENMVKRYHHVDLTDIIQYHGLRPGRGSEGVCGDSDLETFSSDYLITAALVAKPTIERIIYRHAPFHTEGIPYQVFYSLPGHGYEDLHGPLLTYHPDDVPKEKWAKDMDDDKMLPALGSPNALRVLLYVKPFELPFEEISTSERINRLAAAYLLDKHGDMPLLKEVRRHNSDPLLKKSDQGRSPHKWDEWVGMMSTIFEYEAKVPETCDNEASGKLINIIQMSKLVFMQTDWVSKCLKAAKGIDSKWGRAVNKPLRDYLQIETSVIGIEPFLKKVEGFVTQQRTGSGSGSVSTTIRPKMGYLQKSRMNIAESDSEADLYGNVDASKQHETVGAIAITPRGLFGHPLLGATTTSPATMGFNEPLSRMPRRPTRPARHCARPLHACTRSTRSPTLSPLTTGFGPAPSTTVNNRQLIILPPSATAAIATIAARHRQPQACVGAMGVMPNPRLVHLRRFLSEHLAPVVTRNAPPPTRRLALAASPSCLRRRPPLSGRRPRNPAYPPCPRCPQSACGSGSRQLANAPVLATSRIPPPLCEGSPRHGAARPFCLPPAAFPPITPGWASHREPRDTEGRRRWVVVVHSKPVSEAQPRAGDLAQMHTHPRFAMPPCTPPPEPSEQHEPARAASPRRPSLLPALALLRRYRAHTNPLPPTSHPPASQLLLFVAANAAPRHTASGYSPMCPCPPRTGTHRLHLLPPTSRAAHTCRGRDPSPTRPLAPHHVPPRLVALVPRRAHAVRPACPRPRLRIPLAAARRLTLSTAPFYPHPPATLRLPRDGRPTESPGTQGGEDGGVRSIEASSSEANNLTRRRSHICAHLATWTCHVLSTAVHVACSARARCSCASTQRRAGLASARVSRAHSVAEHPHPPNHHQLALAPTHPLPAHGTFTPSNTTGGLRALLDDSRGIRRCTTPIHLTAARGVDAPHRRRRTRKTPASTPRATRQHPSLLPPPTSTSTHERQRTPVVASARVRLPAIRETPAPAAPTALVLNSCAPPRTRAQPARNPGTHVCAPHLETSQPPPSRRALSAPCLHSAVADASPCALQQGPAIPVSAPTTPLRTCHRPPTWARAPSTGDTPALAPTVSTVRPAPATPPCSCPRRVHHASPRSRHTVREQQRLH